MAGALFQKAAAAPRGRPPAKTPETDWGWGVERLLAQALRPILGGSTGISQPLAPRGTPASDVFNMGAKAGSSKPAASGVRSLTSCATATDSTRSQASDCFRPIVARLRNLRIWFGMLNFSVVAPTGLFPSSRFVGNGKYRAGAVLLCPIQCRAVVKGLDDGISRPHTLWTP